MKKRGGINATSPVGERGFEPPTSASRTLRANRAALLPAPVEDTIGGHAEQLFAHDPMCQRRRELVARRSAYSLVVECNNVTAVHKNSTGLRALSRSHDRRHGVC